MKLFHLKSNHIFLFCIVFTFFVMGCGYNGNEENAVVKTDVNTEDTGTEMDSSSTLSAAEKDTVIWNIYFSEYIEIWQEPLNQLLAEKGVPYRVKLEAYHTAMEEPLADAVDTLEKMKQANERADVIAVPSSGYTTMADRKLLMPLDDFLESERGMEIVNSLPERDLARCRYKGTTYGISAHLRTVGAVAYDKALLKKYNIDASELSANIFENESLLQKVKDGEGGKVVPYAYNDNILYSLGVWKVDPMECLAYTKDGEAVNIFETEELRKKLFQIKDFKDKGLLNIVSENGFGSFFATDELVHREDPYESSLSYADNPKQDALTEYLVIPDMQRPQIAPFWGDAQTAIASWSQNQEYALDFLIRLYTDPDIANLIFYGNEGKEYTVEDNVATRLSGNLLWVFGEHYTNALAAFSQNDTARDKTAFQTRYYEQCESFIPDGFRFDSAPVAKEVEATNAVYYESIEERKLSNEINNLFLLNVTDIDAALSEINEKLKEAGIDRIVLEFNRQLAEWRTNYER